MLDEKSLIIIFISEAGEKYEIMTARELRKYNSKVLMIGDNLDLLKIDKSYDYLIDIKSNMDELFKPVFYQIFGQLIGYHQGLKKGRDPSNPKELDYCVEFKL